MFRSRSTASRRTSGAHPFPHHSEELRLHTTSDVLEADEPELSSLLGPDGNPIPYQSKKLGHIGFIKLKEHP